MKKDCAFQYATTREIIADADLITLDEAEALFEKYIPDFMNRLEKDEYPEMAIWVDMKNNTDYRTTSKYWHWSEMQIIDGELFECHRVY